MSRDSLDAWQRKAARERRARRQAEQLLEQKSRALCAVDRQLADANEELERRVAMRTRDVYNFSNVAVPWSRYVTANASGQVSVNQAELRCGSLFRTTSWSGDTTPPGSGTQNDYGFPWFTLRTLSGGYLQAKSSVETSGSPAIWADRLEGDATLFTRSVGGGAFPGLTNFSYRGSIGLTMLWKNRDWMFSDMKAASRPTGLGYQYAITSSLTSTSWWGAGNSRVPSNVDFFVINDAPASCN